MPQKQPPVTQSGRRHFLRTHPIFGALAEDMLEQLTARAVPRSVKRGTVIFRKDDPGSSLFAVRSGSVKISTGSADGKDAVLNIINPDEVFGEIALLDGHPRTADATAVSDCELLVIDRSDFIPLLQSRPEMALRLVEILCSRLRRTTNLVEDIVFLDLPGRLAKVLLHLSRASGARDPALVRITQQEISERVGASRESVNKQLRDWERRHILRLQRGGIIIDAPSALVNLLGDGQQ